MSENKLLVRSAFEKFFVCDGHPPKGKEHDGHIYLGHIYGCFDSYADADLFRLSFVDKG